MVFYLHNIKQEFVPCCHLDAVLYFWHKEAYQCNNVVTAPVSACDSYFLSNLLLVYDVKSETLCHNAKFSNEKKLCVSYTVLSKSLEPSLMSIFCF